MTENTDEEKTQIKKGVLYSRNYRAMRRAERDNYAILRDEHQRLTENYNKLTESNNALLSEHKNANDLKSEFISFLKYKSDNSPPVKPVVQETPQPTAFRRPPKNAFFQ